MTVTRALVLALMAVGAIGCGKSGTTTSPSTTTSGPSTEYFNGTLTPATSSFYSFTVTNPGAVSVTLASTDLDATFATLEASGAEVVQEPTDQPYGIRDCAFRDPAGNTVRINQLG